MSLISIENLSLAFAGRTLFDQVGFGVATEDRIGLVGRNGMGKTSLLRCIMGQLQPDEGEIRIARGLRLGYLPQEIAAPRDIALISSVLESVPGLGGLEREIEQVGQDLQSIVDEDQQQDLAMRLAELMEQREQYETFYARHEAERILAGLGFSSNDFTASLHTFSGGWRMRAALASLLFQRPDVLLLDEPTNHLDLPSVRWFDGFLRKSKTAFVLVSHDRAFLNSQIKRVISLELEGLRSYPGDYDHYEQLRIEEDALLRNRAKNLDRERRDIERFVQRFKAQATKARAASSKAKMLRKMDKVQTLELPKELSFRFEEAPPSGRQVIAVDGLAKAFGDHVLYRKLDLRLYRGERVALVGPNGSGKTTLLRMIAGDMKADAGEISFGHQVAVGYYAQHCADGLHPKLNILQTLWADMPDAGQTRVRTVLGTFLFSGDDALKPVEVLSGGERARVALARIVAQPSNLLIMDEPTNHLDLNASEALGDALLNYTGSVLFVSHNISLLEKVATKIWELADGKVIEHTGGYAGYLRARDEHASLASAGSRSKKHRGASSATIAALQAAPTDPAPVETTRPVSRAGQKAKKRAEAQRRQVIANKLGDLPKRIDKIEKRIHQLEQEQIQREAELAKDATYQDQAHYQHVLRDFTEGQEKLDELMGRWEHMQEQRDRVMAQLDSPSLPEL